MNILDAIQEALAPKPQSVMDPDYKSPTTADLMKSGVLRSLMSMVTSPIDMSIETYNLLNPDRVRTLSERGARALGLAEPRPFTADQSAIDFAGAVTDASPVLAGGLFKAIKESAPSAGRVGLTNQRGAIDVGVGFKFPQDDALATAQRNAAKPVSEGGLGLPADSTPMDRAKAMGFEGGWYHGSGKEIRQFMAKKPIEKDHGWYGSEGAYLTPDPETGSAYANWADLSGKNNGISGQNVMPLMIRKGKVFDYGDAQPLRTREESAEFTETLKRLGYDTVEVPNKMADPRYAKNYETVVIDPSRIRSRFAAFDPARINENDLLAGIAPFALTTGLLGLLGLPKEANAAR